MILYPWYMDKVSPVPSPLETDTSSVFSTPKVQPKKSVVAPQKPKEKISVENFEENYISVSNGVYTAQLSNKNGGSFSSFVLNEFDRHDSSKVDLIYEYNKNNLGLEFISTDGDKITLFEPWTVHSNDKSVDASIEEQTLRFSTSFQGKSLTKTFTFYPGTYKIKLVVDLESVQKSISQGRYSVGWVGGLPSTEKNTKEEYTYYKGLAYLGGELLEPKIKNGDVVSEEQSGKTGWVATQNKYFISAIIPSNFGIGGKVDGEKRGDHPTYDLTLLQDVRSGNEYTLYFGPLEYNRVVNLGVGLENAMNLGWAPIRFIGRLITWSLTIMHKTIPNYGVVLILFAILMKVLLNPLTKKSYQSSRRMQDLQPKIAQLKEKYKNDPQKMNQAQMALFKEEGVNPMGGCFPVLLQMPVLFALFTVFRTTIEFRGEPFVWWIKDLSTPDIIFHLPFNVPLYGSHVAVLPIFMGITMFLQQKLMSTSGAQSQQKMMGYFMTGFFLLLFNGFPSGLNLYYSVFNVLTIVQQKYFTPKPTKPKNTTLKGKKPKKKK